jgi:hypothetical protein|tara:strand:+ start:1010 stop:1411 length:402 start_codon:yes stop_codon:yes gene_type:complete
MDLQKRRRPDHIEDAIITFHRGSWFYWADNQNKIYANLRLHDKVWNSDGTALIDNPVTELPTEAEINAKLAEVQANFDNRTQTYRINRAKEYPSVFDQLDQLWHDIDEGKLDKTGSFYTTVKTIKDKYPKPIT